MPTNRDRQVAIRALQDAATRVNSRARAAAGSPMEQQAQALVGWALSRPDLEEPVESSTLRPDRRLQAGRRVIVDAAVLYFALPLEAAPLVWPSGLVIDANPVGLLLNLDEENDPDEVLHRARMVVAIQHAADGHVPSLLMILRGTGHPRAAEMVEEAAEGFDDWSFRRLGLPSAHELLRHAFHADQFEWEQNVLVETCHEALAHWPALPAGVVAVPIPTEG